MLGIAGAKRHSGLVDAEIEIVDGDVVEPGLAGVGHHEAVGDVLTLRDLGGAGLRQAKGRLDDGDDRADLVVEVRLGVGKLQVAVAEVAVLGRHNTGQRKQDDCK